MSGRLFLVATPIGNRADITLRALEILKSVDLIFSEDTRHTGKLLEFYGIQKPLRSCHAFNEAKRTEEIIQSISEGKKIALVSDAGTPGISDPGYRVVRCCVEKGIGIESIPGPCAAIAALTISGLTTNEFHFVGFLPQKTGACEKKLQALAVLPGTLIFYESPYRLLRTLELFVKIYPERKIVVGREITKKFEEFKRGMAQDILEHFRSYKPKGEFVLLIEAI